MKIPKINQETLMSILIVTQSLIIIKFKDQSNLNIKKDQFMTIPLHQSWSNKKLDIQMNNLQEPKMELTKL